MSGSGPVLELRAVSRSYRLGHASVAAFVDVDLTLGAGDLVGICGPSGSGKSWAGWLPPWRPPTGAPSSSTRRCGPDPGSGRGPASPGPATSCRCSRTARASLDPRWPVWRSLTEAATALPRGRRPDRGRRQELARTQLAAVGLGGLTGDERPPQLFAGQCQRIANQRALTTRPALLVADEPTSALDVTSAAGILRLLRATADAGTAVLIASHDLRALSVLRDRVLVLRAGVLGDA